MGKRPFSRKNCNIFCNLVAFSRFGLKIRAAGGTEYSLENAVTAAFADSGITLSPADASGCTAAACVKKHRGSCIAIFAPEWYNKQ